MSFRFTIRDLPAEDDSGWVRIPKQGRMKLGVKQGQKIKLEGKKTFVRLEVHQCFAGDAGKMIVRIAPDIYRRLGFQEGEVIDIGGEAGKKSEICILAIDCSLSMGDNQKISKVMDAVRDFLDEKGKIKEDGDLVGCIGFAGEAWTIFQPSTAYKTKIGELAAPELKWGTNLVKPLDMARSIITGGKGAKKAKTVKSDMARHVILLADGNSEQDPTEAARTCRAAGIVVDTVGVIDPGNKQHQLSNLECIARITGGKYIDIDQAKLSKLRGIFRRAAKDKAI